MKDKALKILDAVTNETGYDFTDKVERAFIAHAMELFAKSQLEEKDRENKKCKKNVIKIGEYNEKLESQLEQFSPLMKQYPKRFADMAEEIKELKAVIKELTPTNND